MGGPSRLNFCATIDGFFLAKQDLNQERFFEYVAETCEYWKANTDNYAFFTLLIVSGVAIICFFDGFEIKKRKRTKVSETKVSDVRNII